MRKILVIVLLLWPDFAYAGARDVARSYLEARCKTLQRGATAHDVERVVRLLSDDIVLQHPRFGAVVDGKEAVRRGLLSHLDDYLGNEKNSGIELLSLMEAPGVVIMKTRTTFLVRDKAGERRISSEGVTVAEVAGDQIRRLIEY